MTAPNLINDRTSDKMNIQELADKDETLSFKISNTHQLGGIETSVLDNGTAKGARIAWINTGSGLRYKLLLDSAMDIADAAYNQYNLSWISHCGAVPGNSRRLPGDEWLTAFGGGLLTTCGLSHIGAAEKDGHEYHDMNGMIGHQPAEIIEVRQPDILRGNLNMSITGLIKETTSFGKHMELKRTISATLGDPQIHIFDEVTNVGHESIPHMLLYHCNFGWPLVDEGTYINWQGPWTSRGKPGDDQIFAEGSDYKNCKAPGAHGDACAFIDIEPDENGICNSALINRKLELAVVLTFKKKELPWLTNWQHYKKGEYVVGLEPGTNALTGRTAARSEGNLIFLQPKECRHYNLSMKILYGKQQIDSYLLHSKSVLETI